MKKLVNFIINLLIRIFMFLIVLLLLLFTCTYIFSLQNNISFEDTILYFQEATNKIISYKLNLGNTENIILNDTTDIEVSTPITSINVNYYYEQLNDTAKIIYNSLEQNIDNLKKENYVINFSTKFDDLLHKPTGQSLLNRSFQSALGAFLYDHPELFYIDFAKISLNTRCISLGPLKTYLVEIAPINNTNYLIEGFNSEQDVIKAIAIVEKTKNEVVNSVANQTVYKKILTVHDMLVNSLEYDTTFTNNHINNIYGALVKRNVVCEGYAKAFKYILDSLNIECILVNGTASNSTSDEPEAHMWNYVKLNGAWYGVDVTWDDPIIIGNIGSTSTITRRDYFLKGYLTFAYSHIPSGKISNTGMLFALPTLSDTNYK